MKGSLEHEFSTPVRAIEENSLTTVDSARRCAELLKPLGIHRVLLVTDYWHAPRSRAAFKDAGFDVVVAPMGFSSFDGSDPREWLPTANGLSMSRIAFREIGGYAVTRLAAKAGLSP
jgi:uncharacterized SAM-binding protein YcdF (DUF218 family)